MDVLLGAGIADIFNSGCELCAKIERIGHALTGEPGPYFFKENRRRQQEKWADLQRKAAREWRDRRDRGSYSRYSTSYTEPAKTEETPREIKKKKKLILAKDGMMEMYTSETILESELDSRTKQFVDCFTKDGSFYLERLIDKKSWRKLLFCNGKVRLVHKMKIQR